MIPVLACAGHVLIDLPLFGSPVLLLAGAVTWMVRSERRRGEVLRREADRAPTA
jgi:hypothetical protein